MNQKYHTPAISVNAAAKKYGIAQATLARWAKRGLLKVLQYPERKGQKMLVDEASVVAAMQGRLRNLTRANPGPQQIPIKYCPYCGKPLPW